ncbi:MAG: glycosyltransferase family 2 protein [Pseudobutyrivibrio ruminis]|nr:glycosyltransferase family 2 protein [Pseudobutyrivibrio ruminis]
MNNKNALISVVVPIYKVESYLRRCIESILSQTYRNFELILVDDGSPDCSGKICDDYADKDRRIKVIHKENGGLSDARNYGTRTATGDYISYIDSDDWVAPDYLELLYKALEDNAADVSVCKLIKINKEKCIRSSKNNILMFSTDSALSDMLYQKNISNSACGKLIRRKVMNRFPFPVGRLYEDLFTTYKVISECNKIVFVDRVLYYYWINPESIMHQSFSPKMFDEIDAVCEIEQFVREHFPNILSAALSRKFSSYSQVFRWMSKEKIDSVYLSKKKSIWGYIKEYRYSMLLDKNARLKNRIAGFLALGGSFLYGHL